MARAVMLPITDFNPNTPRLDGVETRLKAMIANSDAHDGQVRMWTAAFAPEAIKANETRQEISEQTSAEVLTAFDTLRRVTEYNARAKASRQFLTDTLAKYDKSAASAAFTAGARRDSVGVAPVARRDSTGVASVALMNGAPTAAMEGERSSVAPTAPKMSAPMPAPSATQMAPRSTGSNIDASRDPRRR
ncbi:hypothetical protein E4T42_00524 [Aureobasidium subglaciale]|nr:hypothetical protein E4T38_05029 [Aureobasidium subglaciale]KAI5222272.1 hypothetical protein E4T40_05067 [Aureobasidium subglaciale]KAI5226383.1 hypothetical protein E4T41_04886 [Aureobasidium subglaciale]KAI5258882.1 hypothetical protein E4T42_00524 [Aureobasidium subglaciale]KAI5262024.1 hypothetical protein E4T46_04779 [Aureobasidium subglaciale]